MDLEDYLKAQENYKFLDEKPFLVMARVAIQLGRESISDSITAIMELVKNAYDADAEEIKIRFSGLGSASNLNSENISVDEDDISTILIVEDTGTGMTSEQLKTDWLVIGTPNKLKKPKSTKGRILTGEKGLGRLGLDRLGRITIVRTFTENEPFGTELVIDWQKYEDINQILENVNHKLFQIPKKIVDPITGQEVEVNKGTQLIVYGLKDPWTADNLLNLKKELTYLFSASGQ